MANCIKCHQPQTAAPVICPECYRALTERTETMENDKKLMERLRAEARLQDGRFSRYTLAKELSEAADCIEALTAQLTEKDKQLGLAVEDLRGLCWCCAYGKKWDKAPAWSNMTTCEHIRERGSLAVGGGKAGKDCPHWEWRGAQEAGEVEHD